MTKWIEGESNLNEFCLRRFKEKPKFIETIGHCGEVTVYMIYKYRQDKHRYTQMFFLFLRHSNGTVSEGELSDKSKMTYEEIRADKNSILVE